MRISLSRPDKGELLGYFSLTIDYSLWRDHIWAHLDCLYVTTNERGKGVGAGLLAEAIAVARRLGADQLEWQTPEWNERGVAFTCAKAPFRKLRCASTSTCEISAEVDGMHFNRYSGCISKARNLVTDSSKTG